MSTKWVPVGAVDKLNQLVGEIKDAGSPVMFVSPHLDDAVLSCGALLTQLARTNSVTVLTVFSSARPPAKWAPSARNELRSHGATDAMKYFEDRRAEDIAALQAVGASWIHLGFTDAPFRRVGETAGKDTGRAAYPSFHFNIARGWVAPSDATLATKVGAMVRDAVSANGVTTVFAPLGVGRHVDHLITRNAVAAPGIDAVYYSDFPYSQTAKPSARFVRKESLRPCTWLPGRAENVNLIARYKTQADGLFPRGIPVNPETYWIRVTDSASAK
jgi:LmbE family N-acetylglucosaminyl deacetylase